MGKTFSYQVGFYIGYENGNQSLGDTCVDVNSKVSRNNITQFKEIVKTAVQRDTPEKIKTLVLLSFQRI